MKKALFILLSISASIALLFRWLFSACRKAWLFVHRRKILAIPFYAFLAFFLYVWLVIQISGDPDFAKTIENKRINDVTQLNPIHTNQVIRPRSIPEIKQAIMSSSGPISIGGGKYSMGGQTAFENSLHIDMRSFKQVIELDTIQKTIRVQPGISWRELQKVIDPYNLSVKIMQTYANFTVGGSVSVNCHGRYIGHGPIISSVKHLKILTASGELMEASRQQNQDVFNAAIGGYGGIGVIVEVTLQLDDNVKVERQLKKMKVADYRDFFDQHIKNNQEVVFQNGDLYPPDYSEINNVSWVKSTKPLTDPERLTASNESYFLERQLMKVISWGNTGKWFRKSLLDPLLYRPEKVVWRNKEASYDVLELEPSSRQEDTYVLQEYFIPVRNFETFIPKMKSIFQKYEVNVINVSLRHALTDQESYLSWAPEEVFAFVVYYKQSTADEAKEQVKEWTQEMTDAILSEDGSWYLPYQPHASPAQFNRGYPQADKYFALKNRLDPEQRFTNKLLDKYNPYAGNKLTQERKNISGYFRAEEQTILTVPEWYLVFNPKEYADYLESGDNPSDFPFYASIGEYWRLYDRSLKLASLAYPENEEYKTMLQVIGISVTMEYCAKLLYENSLGRLFSLFAEAHISHEEKVIIEAQRAYSNFIYHTAWYEFEFLPWIKKVWTNAETSESSLLRQWERSLLFTLEFSFKAFYAQLIDWAASSNYEPSVNNIYLIASANEPIREHKDLQIIKEQEGKSILGITRWGAFTETLVALSAQDITIEEIAGNDEIVVSVLMDLGMSLNDHRPSFLYESRVVTDPAIKREVYLLPVKDLLPFIRQARSKGITIEHIYDY